jgi:tRNA nucleotidyltransferase (CCA-adding enzyme)
MNSNINITSEEKELFNILKTIIREKAPNTTLRIAGGWIRNKLLGKEASDIDIMVDNLSGEQIANLVSNYLSANPAHIIKSNPEKSKNITTAKAYIPLPSSGKVIEVDFAQARTEIYKDDSRVPEVMAATPEEDALRRDFTMNSLFYNLNTNLVEDFTGKGIKDIIAKTVRTPLDPLMTFKEDPLRIFRCIRFASQLGFTIHSETYEAMKNPELIEDIKKKISKERIGQELQKIFKNPNSEIGISLLKDTGLLQELLKESLVGTKYEGKMADLDMDQNNPNHKLSLWGHTFQVINNLLKNHPEYEGERRVVMILAALTHDIGKLYSEIQTKRIGTDKYPGHEKGYTSYIGHEDESAEIVKHILKFLKLDPYIKEVSDIVKNHMKLHSFTRDDSGAKAFRKFIRNMGEASLQWMDILNLSTADAYSKDKTVSEDTIAEYNNLKQQLESAVSSLSIGSKEKVAPILNGNEIMQALNIKPGPHMNEITEFVKGLKDDNPDITKEEAILLLKDKFGKFKTAQTKKRKPSGTICSKHLLNKKIFTIKTLLKENKEIEALTIVEDLLENYEADEDVVKNMALFLFKILLINPKLRNNKTLLILFNKAEENFFDIILNASVLGLLLMLETGTKDEVIKEVASRVYHLSPENYQKVIDMIPKERIIKPKLLENISE